MKKIPVDINTTFSDLDLTELTEIVDECSTVIDLFTDLEEVIVSEEKYIENGRNLEELPDLQLDVIEAISYNLRYASIEKFTTGMCAPTDALVRRSRSLTHYLEQAKIIADEISGPFIPLTTDQVELLRELTSNVLAETSFFLYYQFRLNNTSKNLECNEEPEVSVAIKSFLDESGEDLKEFIDKVKSVMSKYRPKLNIFELIPELEDEFLDIAGAYIRDFELVQQLLTTELIVGIIEGKLEAEETLHKLESDLYA